MCEELRKLASAVSNQEAIYMVTEIERECINKSLAGGEHIYTHSFDISTTSKETIDLVEKILRDERHFTVAVENHGVDAYEHPPQYDVIVKW